MCVCVLSDVLVTAVGMKSPPPSSPSRLRIRVNIAVIGLFASVSNIGKEKVGNSRDIFNTVFGQVDENHSLECCSGSGPVNGR